ncbi:MAG: hypothetical protein WA761_05515, partial [Thermoplasmata archaeon]
SQEFSDLEHWIDHLHGAHGPGPGHETIAPAPSGERPWRADLGTSKWFEVESLESTGIGGAERTICPTCGARFLRLTDLEDHTRGIHAM